MSEREPPPHAGEATAARPPEPFLHPGGTAAGPGPEPPLPLERLDPAVVTLWRIEYALTTAFGLVAGVVASMFLDGALAVLAWALPLAAGLAAVAALPGMRYRRWRFEVSAEEIDLRRGALEIRRTLVPMRRVQHVDSISGVLERWLSLATVVVHTAGGAVTIPGLGRSRALALHERIAALARLADDD